MAYQQERIKPYSQQGEKKAQVEAMFDRIAPTYDILNHTLSLGIDRGWRQKAIDRLKPFAPQRMLDIATGTGDFALMAACTLKPQKLIGADISEGMMQVGREKVRKAGLQDIISFEQQDCLHLSYADNSFDAVTAAYGIRNFAQLDQCLCELHRVIRPGGHLLIVELATPPHFPMKQLFWLYAHIVMPLAGRLISGDAKAYSYLPATMEAFPQGEVMDGILRRTGFSDVYWKRFTFGICTMYLARK